MYRCKFKFNVQFDIEIEIEHEEPFSSDAVREAKAVLEKDALFQGLGMRAKMDSMCAEPVGKDDDIG